MNHTQPYPINLMLPAQIDYHGRIFSATMGNLTPEGALLETHGLTLPTGMEVELTLTVAHETWSIKALITHTTPHEIGLMFKQSQHELFSAACNDCTLPFRPRLQPKQSPALSR
ncbi:MAG: PilZ domain-containing protein [Sedimenticola sp.]|nr:PilZ domain-containing protein [Sedimenticola sp.]